jgi:hypothetical protein
MEREETEEKESVRKTEKERHEMKYKVGDKVRVRRDLERYRQYGKYDANRNMAELHGSIVEIKKVENEEQRYEINDNLYYWTDEMFEGLAEEELTAEEAIRFKCEMCESISCSECKFSRANNGEDIYCNKFLEKYPEQVVEILKQWKKDHEKKPIKTESVGIVRVIEDTGFRRKCVYEEELTERENPMDAKERVLKEYCQKHAGKFFTVFESICRVKE